MMDLSVHVTLEQALDLGWRILADCFEPAETGISTKLIDKFWPGAGAPTPAEAPAPAPAAVHSR